jgi:hypothetical protein
MVHTLSLYWCLPDRKQQIRADPHSNIVRSDLVCSCSSHCQNRKRLGLENFLRRFFDHERNLEVEVV